MDPLSIGLTVGGALFGGISNLLGASDEERQYRRRADAAKRILSANLIGEGEMKMMLNNTERLFNSRLTSTLNATALRSRGIANANVVGGAVAGAMEGSKLEALGQQRTGIMSQNAQTRSSIANIEANTPVTNKAAAFVSGTLGGAQMGYGAAKLIGTLGAIDSLKPTGPYNEATDIINNAQTEDIPLDIGSTPNAETVLNYSPAYREAPSSLQAIFNADVKGMSPTEVNIPAPLENNTDTAVGRSPAGSLNPSGFTSIDLPTTQGTAKVGGVPMSYAQGEKASKAGWAEYTDEFKNNDPYAIYKKQLYSSKMYPFFDGGIFGNRQRGRN